MTPSKFELDVLEFVRDDYEAVHTIRDNVARDVGRTVPDSEIAAALINLVNAGLVDVFLLDSKPPFNRKVKIGAAPVEELWFLANNSSSAG